MITHVKIYDHSRHGAGVIKYFNDVTQSYIYDLSSMQYFLRFDSKVNFKKYSSFEVVGIEDFFFATEQKLVDSKRAQFIAKMQEIERKEGIMLSLLAKAWNLIEGFVKKTK